jgi:tRNA (guanine37-N1)-methyltransferase
MKIQIITLFPEMFPGVFNASMLWKAQDKGIAEISYINLRSFGIGPRKQVDDTPYGGGDGMLLKPEPLVAAIEAAQQRTAYSVQRTGDKTNPKAARSTLNAQRSKVILLTPRGERYTQAKARELTQYDDLILVCARYEGYDERVTEYVDEQISIGDYVLTGGEIPAMVVVDSVVRLLPGVLGGETSALIESFSDGQNLEYPQYTRPENFRGLKVPNVLLSGNHAEIDKWRKNKSE